MYCPVRAQFGITDLHVKLLATVMFLKIGAGKAAQFLWAYVKYYIDSAPSDCV
jgi:hypothetical protein